MRMSLYYIWNGKCGNSDVICYVWAPNSTIAQGMFLHKYPNEKIEEIKELVDSDDKEPFITELSGDTTQTWDKITHG